VTQTVNVMLTLTVDNMFECRNVERVHGLSSKRWKARTSKSWNRPSVCWWQTSRAFQSRREEEAIPSIPSTNSNDITS